MADFLEDDFDRTYNYGQKEWDKLEETFTNAGYREGITAGKEEALQEGFDDGYMRYGAPIGREIGILRGLAGALLGFLEKEKGLDATGADRICSEQSSKRWLNEVQTMVHSLQRISLLALLPPDLDAIQHAKEHEDMNKDSLDTGELGGKERKDMEAVRQELDKLKDQLHAVATELGYGEAALVLV